MSTPSTVEPSPVKEESAVPLGYREALLRFGRRIVVLVLGTSVVLVGIVMIVTPGPAVVVIPLGLGILATEFLWARRILESLKRRFIAGQEMLPDSPFYNRLRRWLPKRPDQS